MRTNNLFTLFILSLLFQPLKGQLVFNEVMAVNTSGEYNMLTGEYDDWIEIYNGSEYAVDLAGYYLSDDPKDPLKWSFPEKTYLWPGSYHLIWADGTNQTEYGSHTNFKLSGTGETLFLYKASGELYDSLSYPAMYENISYGYSMDGSSLYFKEPTPGTANNNGTGFLYSGGVTIDPPAAIYSNPIELSIQSYTTGGTIRYTLDGSAPDIDDPMYTTPIIVAENSVVRARLWEDGFEPGDISTSSYIFSEGFTLPVVSLSTDPYNLWDDSKGIYVEGSNGISGYCSDVPKNWNQDWERPLSFEYFDLEGVRHLQLDGGTKIHGGCSRQNPMKSLAFFARSRYGNNEIKYPFFSKKEADSFKGLILRNSGNDFQYSFMRDPMIQAVVSPVMNLDYQAYEPVQVFLNGEYWGIHNLREKVNEHWVSSNYGIPVENIDFIKNRNEVFAGSMDGYDSLNILLTNHNITKDENFQQVADWIDLDSYTEYLFTHMFFANRDWPGNNQKFWRDRVNGSKWRWILFDLDFTLGIYQFEPSIDMFTFSTASDSDEWPNPAWATLLIRRLLDNQTYREEFIKQYQVHLNTTFSAERVNHVIDSFYYRLADIYPAHIERWPRASWLKEWEYYVDQLRIFSTDRPDHVRRNMRNFFNLGEDISLQVEPMDHSGQIKMNGVLLPKEGMNGFYSAGLNLDLEFLASPGYMLDQWEVITATKEEAMILPRNSLWKYNDTDVYPGSGWQENGFDDSDWQEGKGELGFGDSGEATLLDYGSDELNKPITYYFRSQVEIMDPGHFDKFTIAMLHDDGAIVYINGKEVVRYNLPAGEILPGTLALTPVGGADENTYFEYPLSDSCFVSGTNLMAVEIHQSGPGSSDLSFDLELTGFAFTNSDTVIYEGSSLTLTPDDGIIIKAVSGVRNIDPDIPLYINEFMASNQGTHLDEYGEDADWFEVFNAGEKDIDLAGLYVTDDLAVPGKWRIPSGAPELTTVISNDYLVLYADGDTLQGPLHVNFKLNTSGESIGISALSGSSFIWLDSINFGPQISNTSYGRLPDGGNDWMTLNPHTPGYSNLLTYTNPVTEREIHLNVFPNPTADWLNISLKGEAYEEDHQVKLSLYDLTGRRVEHREIRIWNGSYSGRIDLSLLPSGVYILTLENGSTRLTKKIVKSGL